MNFYLLLCCLHQQENAITFLKQEHSYEFLKISFDFPPLPFLHFKHNKTIHHLKKVPMGKHKA